MIYTPSVIAWCDAVLTVAVHTLGHQTVENDPWPWWQGTDAEEIYCKTLLSSSPWRVVNDHYVPLARPTNGWPLCRDVSIVCPPFKNPPLFSDCGVLIAGCVSIFCPHCKQLNTPVYDATPPDLQRAFNEMVCDRCGLSLWPWLAFCPEAPEFESLRSRPNDAPVNLVNFPQPPKKELPHA